MIADVAAALDGVRIDADGRFGPLRFPAGLAVFAGHFPGLPLVPGVYLLELARQVASRRHGAALRLREVVDAKFTAEVHPDRPITGVVAITAGDDGDWRADVALDVDATPAARLRLRLDERGDR